MDRLPYIKQMSHLVQTLTDIHLASFCQSTPYVMFIYFEDPRIQESVKAMGKIHKICQQLTVEIKFY